MCHHPQSSVLFIPYPPPRTALVASSHLRYLPQHPRLTLPAPVISPPTPPLPAPAPSTHLASSSHDLSSPPHYLPLHPPINLPAPVTSPHTHTICPCTLNSPCQHQPQTQGGSAQGRSRTRCHRQGCRCSAPANMGHSKQVHTYMVHDMHCRSDGVQLC